MSQPSITQTDSGELARIFKVLSVHARVEIIRLLKKHPMCVNALAARLQITQGAVSQHLRVMRDNGIVQAEKRGYFVHYRIDLERLAAWHGRVHELLGPAETDSEECEGC